MRTTHWPRYADGTVQQRFQLDPLLDRRYILSVAATRFKHTYLEGDTQLEYESYPANTADLLEHIQRGWDKLWAAIDGLTPAQMETPDAGGWSIKDNLAHLTAWERYMLLHYLQDRPAGEGMGLDDATAQSHYDVINAALFERNRDRSLDDVTESARSVHREVVDFLAGLPFDTLMRQMYEDDPEKRPVLAWVVGNTFGHYEEHMDAIQALVERTSSF